jgi:hypothetical protein
METSEDWLHQYSVLKSYLVAVCRSRSRCQRRWDSRSETLVWTAVIVVGNPLNQRAFQVMFGKRYQKVQAFSASAPHQSFAEAICFGDRTGNDAFCVIPNEGHPTLLRIRSTPRPASRAQVLADSTRRDAETKFEPKLVGDSGFAPDSVLSCHSADEFPKVARQPRSASRPGLPPPEQAKSFPMPTNKGVGLDHAECAAPVKEPAQSRHHQPDRVGRPVRLRFALLKERELFTEEEILCGQSGARPEA